MSEANGSWLAIADYFWHSVGVRPVPKTWPLCVMNIVVYARWSLAFRADLLGKAVQRRLPQMVETRSENASPLPVASLVMGHWGTCPSSYGNSEHSAAIASLIVKFRKSPKKNTYYIFVYHAKNTLKLT